jgi:ubiquinol-cytochrome c reductase iron-sulfur subunit
MANADAPRRRRLRGAVAVLGGMGGILFTAVFLYGLFSPAGPRSSSIVDFGGIAAGEAQLLGWSGRPVWVVHRSPRQLEALALTSGHVRAATDKPQPGLHPQARSLLPQYGIYLAETESPGILVQFVAERPRRLAPGLPWQGGFINPDSGEVFDLAGRPYRAATPPAAAPLTVPPHRYLARELVEMGSW